MNLLLCKYKKVLEGGIISQITDSDISKTAFKTDYIMINGQRLTISMMDRATLMLLIDYPILDTSLPYVNIFIFNIILSITKIILH